MELCVVSGKGGTGKTTVAVGLAVALASRNPGQVQLLDCDVEAPNAHLYLHPEAVVTSPTTVYLPQWDKESCTYCGDCAKACVFGAMGLFGTHLEIFAEHCHSCGACEYVCPTQAIAATSRTIGQIHRSSVAGIELAWGDLDVGEPRAVPIIEELRDCSEPLPIRIVDGPPGTACSLVAAARNADASLIVTEPTPFGLHDLQLAAAVLRVLGVPGAVIINKSGTERDHLIHEYCTRQGLPVVMEIPLESSIARAGAAGTPLPTSHPEYVDPLFAVWAACRSLARQEAAA